MIVETEVKVDLSTVFNDMSRTEQEEHVTECLDLLPDNVLSYVLGKYVEYMDEKAMIKELERLGYKVTEDE